MLLHAGWISIWRKQSSPDHRKHAFVPPVDPLLAADPDVQGAKIEVVGPLANQMRAPSGNAADPESLISTLSHGPGSNDPASNDGNAPAAQAPVSSAPASVDLVSGFRHVEPRRICHGQIRVGRYRDIPFEVPAHSSLPRLKGAYKDLAPSRNPGMMLLTNDQFHDFLRGQIGDAVSWNDGSSGTIDLALSPTHFQSQTYHLILRGSPGGIAVQADFTVSFE